MLKSCSLIIKYAENEQVLEIKCTNLTFKHEKKRGKTIKTLSFLVVSFHKELNMKKQYLMMLSESRMGFAPKPQGDMAELI